MSKLELKHLAPYLPYGVKFQVKDNGVVKIDTLLAVYADGSCSFANIVESQKGFEEIKPILRSFAEFDSYFSKLFDKDIEVRTFTNDEFLEQYGIENIYELEDFKIEWHPVGLFNLLIKHHFDVFDLIPQGLAIDINDVKENEL